MARDLPTREPHLRSRRLPPPRESRVASVPRQTTAAAPAISRLSAAHRQHRRCSPELELGRFASGGRVDRVRRECQDGAAIVSCGGMRAPTCPADAIRVCSSWTSTPWFSSRAITSSRLEGCRDASDNVNATANRPASGTVSTASAARRMWRPSDMADALAQRRIARGSRPQSCARRSASARPRSRGPSSSRSPLLWCRSQSRYVSVLAYATTRSGCSFAHDWCVVRCHARRRRRRRCRDLQLCERSGWHIFLPLGRSGLGRRQRDRLAVERRSRYRLLQHIGGRSHPCFLDHGLFTAV